MATKATKPATRASTAVVVPKAKMELPAHIVEKQATDVAAFQARLGAATGNRIAVTQDRKFRAPGGDKFDTLSGVIVDFIAKKAWYEGAYDKDNIVPPNCFALEFAPHSSLEPSDNSPDKQCESCGQCPKNLFKSAENGKGKACKDSYILALLPPPDENGEFDPDAPMMTLELSATAIKGFEKYNRDLARDYGKAPYCFVTEFFMDDTVDYASVRCGNPQAAPAALVAAALDRRDEAASLLSKEPDVSEFDEKVRNKVKSKLAAPKKQSARARA